MMATNTELVDASIKEKLWHKLRSDLEGYFPPTKNNNLLMCAACGRFLQIEDFSLEHIIPQQALSDDPIQIRENHETPKNVRSGNILLCNKRLRVKDQVIYQNGCNSWKGRFYDTPLREMLNGGAFSKEHRRITNRYLIAAMSLAYLAMVHEYGYQVALTQSGLLLREQFFHPDKFIREMPLKSQMILGGQVPAYEGNLKYWSNPFNFTIQQNFCLVGFRSMVMYLPLSRDPRTPIARHLMFKPSTYKLRPDFRTAFE